MLGIIANPASGKDIRRLISGASVFDNQEKRNIVRRAVRGALTAGVREFVYLADSHGISHSAFDGLDSEASFERVRHLGTDSALDTTRAAAEMRDRGCRAILVLGGDGTNRAVALGWRDAPVVALSTGTNNVFPRMLEGTLAGLAAGLVTTGAVERRSVTSQAKCVQVEIDGERDDLALIDAVHVVEPFVGARAIWNPATLRTIVLARAEPASVGMSAVGGLIRPVPDAADEGLLVEVGPGGSVVTAPIAPGLFAEVPVSRARTLRLGEEVSFTGPGVLALDGERERRLKPEQAVRARVLRDGPLVIDVGAVMLAASCKGLFQDGVPGGLHGD